MRISDWSSDVCSSDLGRVPHPERRRSIDRENAPADMADAAIDLDAIVLAVEIIDDADLAVGHSPGIAIAEIPASAVVADDEFGPQLGRASCRERVCQYV